METIPIFDTDGAIIGKAMFVHDVHGQLGRIADLWTLTGTTLEGKLVALQFIPLAAMKAGSPSL